MANHSMDEHDAVSALTGMSLDHLLQGMGAAGSSITNRLGMAGISALNSDQIYGDKYDEEAVGVDTGEDWEAQVDKELQDEGDDGYVQPVQKMKRKRTRVVRRMVERPKSVYERFPAFRKNEILDFSELFQGYTARKSRLVKRPFHSESLSGTCV
jgi:transcription initiation factor TFIID subunit 1, fungi type